MSLLMDALRKAEQAKRQAEGTTSGGLPPALELEPTAADLAGRPPAPPPGPPLPELPSKLEFLDDQFGSVGEGSAPVKPRVGTTPRGKPAADQASIDRQVAQQIFAAKEPTQASRRPFHVALAAAILVAVCGIGGYLWWQLQPRNSLATAPTAGGPARDVGQAPPAKTGVGAAPAAATAAAAGTAVRPSNAKAEPAVNPPAPAARPMASDSDISSRGDQPLPRPTRAPRRSMERGQLADSAANATPVADTSVRVSRARPHTDPGVERGYRHYQAGKLSAARAEYEDVLRRDPNNVDALNGLAAIALRNGSAQTAETYYQRALEADPQDAIAQAGLAGLRGKADPVQAESRLKTLAAAQPEAHASHFALGNLYAGQGRWAEAQQAYFRAYTGDPGNPDYQFNLAVSLDQLRQPRLALQYYQGALASAGSRSAAFDPMQAAARVRELQQP